jgi:hypothetical protein
MAYSTAAADHVAETTGVVASPLTASLRRVSWGAILVGVVVALALEPAQQGSNPSAMTVGIGAAVWWALAGIIAAFTGGWVASRLAGIPSREAGLLHGLGAWAATTLLVLYLLGSTASSLLGGAFNLVGQTASGLGSAASDAVAAANPLEAIQDEVRSAANPNDPQAAGRQLATAVGRVLTSEGDTANQARQAAVDVMVRQGMTQEDAQRRIAEWEQQYRETRDQAAQQARAAADATADGASTAALYGFIALLLGALAGAFGGRAGTPELDAVVAGARRAHVG